MLGIGENAYGSTRLLRIVDESLVTVISAGGGAAVASSSIVANVFFPAGIMGLLGLTTAATPVGWVIASAAAAALGYRGFKTLSRKLVGPVEVIPRYINSPIDVLAASLLDVMAPLALRVAHADGTYHDVERQSLRNYFTNSWGYNAAFVDLSLGYAEVEFPKISTEEIAHTFADFCKQNRDCQFPSIALNVEGFLKDLTRADGQISEEEQRELVSIRHAFRPGKFLGG
ncbi:MAG: TerB family tellurite resistance protein [Rhodobacteraceae bacterium]|nr:TerB family tellurite resistance protein [Paracoccaceae bacterium]